MTHRTPQAQRDEAGRVRLANAHIMQLAAANRRERANRHTIYFGAAIMVLATLALMLHA